MARKLKQARWSYAEDRRLELAKSYGRIDILINSGDLCRSISMGNLQAAFSCDAMQAEMKPGDTVLLDRTNGVGMTVRYLLPRAN